MNFISAIFGAIGKFFGWATVRAGENNSPAMQAAKAAQSEQAQLDASTKSVATKNTPEVRNELSE